MKIYTEWKLEGSQVTSVEAERHRMTILVATQVRCEYILNATWTCDTPGLWNPKLNDDIVIK